jgi:hypothetical protein
VGIKSRLREPALKAAQVVAVRGYGRATAGRRALPNLLIAGGQRCGTTSMYKALRQHPDAFPPRLHKGAHYFDTNYANGIGWYRAFFPTETEVRRRADATGIEPVVFESSPYYGFHPLAAPRFAADLPGVKLIVLLRDPVERAYSAHAHEKARGFETEDFPRALELEDERLEGEEDKLRADPAYNSHAHQHQAYLRRGNYVELLRRLSGEVGRDRVHVVDSQQFFEQPEPVFAGVLEFLGLPPAQGIGFEQHNARPRSPMADDLRSRLEAHFTESDQELADWLGWRPSWMAPAS